MFKSLIIFILAVILFIVGVVVAAVTGTLFGIAGKQWLDEKAKAMGEKEAEREAERTEDDVKVTVPVA